MSPQDVSIPQPMPAAYRPPVAVTVPPEMVMLPQVVLSCAYPPPMPAAPWFPPVAVIVPPAMTMLPQPRSYPPPMPAP